MKMRAPYFIDKYRFHLLLTKNASEARYVRISADFMNCYT